MINWLKICITTLTVVTSSWVTASPVIEPSFTKVKLKEFTPMQLEVMPDAGTQLIFPFELDNPDLRPALKMRLTNANGFYVPVSDSDIKNLIQGKNTITIIGKTNPQNATHLGNLFINIGGYNLSIALRTTYEPDKHKSNIIFEIDDKERTHMVENMVRERTKYYEEQLEKIKDANEKSMDDSSLIHLAKIARITPKNKRFKEEGSINIGGNRIVMFADSVLSYGDLYHSFLFEMENKSSKDFLINGIDIVVKKDGGEHALLGSLECDNRLESGQNKECVFTTSKPLIKNNDEMKMIVKTDRGVGEFSW